MTITRQEIITRSARRIGAQTGSIASGTGTNAVLNGLIGTTGDNTYYAADRLIMMDAATEADRERLITGWADSTGTATFATRADATYTDENYILVNREDYTLNEFRNALLKAGRFTRRGYRLVIPLVPNLPLYPLATATWIEGAGDILGVFISYSPNMLHNEDFALWPQLNPAASTPDGWTLAGAGATVARSSTGIRSPYGATLSSVSADATLYQSIPAPTLQYLTRSYAVILLPWQVGAWVTCSTASTARVGVYNGSTTNWSAYHSGSGLPEWLTPATAYTPTATDTDCRIVLQVATGTHSATFHAGVLESNTMLPVQDKDRGSQSYVEIETQYAQRNVGGMPAIELSDQPAIKGQLIVYTLRPFPDMTADTDSVDDQYGRVLTAGLLRFLLEANKPNQDRSRLDRVMVEESHVWTRELSKLVDLPIPAPPQRLEVIGA